LTSFTIPSSISNIREYTFDACYSLTSIVIPSAVTTIENYAFGRCYSLNSISIPASVTTIGERNPFNNCNLKTIQVESGNSSFKSIDGILYTTDGTRLIACIQTKLGRIDIPSSVNKIGSNAFGGCSALTTISIPATVNYFGLGAFSDCSVLSSIYANAPIPVDLSKNGYVFYNVNKTTCTLYVPIGSRALYQAANQWKDFINIVEVNTTNSKNINQINVNIFPNPIANYFQVSGLKGISLMQLTDLTGKILLQKKVSANENVSVASLSKGVYMINLTNNGVTYQIKVIKK